MSRLQALLVLTVCSFFGIVLAEESCEKIDTKLILEGCSKVKGLTIISQGGTVVNDSNCDVLLPKLIFAKEPNVTFTKAQTSKFYTVLTLDPDAPNHSSGNFFLHMIKSNVPGSSLLNGNISSGEDVTSYRGPNPPKGTKDHRYIFLVFQQKSGDAKLPLPKERAQFNAAEWIKDLPMCGFKAGVQFRARHEL